MMKYFGTDLSLSLCGLRLRIRVELDEEELAVRSTGAPRAHPVSAREESPAMPSIRFSRS